MEQGRHAVYDICPNKTPTMISYCVTCMVNNSHCTLLDRLGVDGEVAGVGGGSIVNCIRFSEDIYRQGNVCLMGSLAWWTGGLASPAIQLLSVY